MNAATAVALASHPATETRESDIDWRFAADVLTGLSMPQKAISSTWLYDLHGSELFEEITSLDEYYPTRTEIGILERCAPAIAAVAGSDVAVIELGSGSSRKTPLLLKALNRPQAYIPIDVSAEFLHSAMDSLRHSCPQLQYFPVVADFTQPLELPPSVKAALGSSRRVGFFPGSTIGNLSPHAAAGLLTNAANMLRRDALMIVGTDITRDPAMLVPAYNDARGVTARFNLNLLKRINRELQGDFKLPLFAHEARFNSAQRRIEMHLIARVRHSVEVLGRRFTFEAGESIHTENSYKYALSEFKSLARTAGWRTVNVWTDPRARFAVHLLAHASRQVATDEHDWPSSTSDEKTFALHAAAQHAAAAAKQGR